MSIVVTCQCGQRFAAKPHLAGRIVACPKCRATLQVPMSPPTTTPVQTPSPAAPMGAQIVLQCYCGARSTVSAHFAGSQVACPSCRQPILVPSGTQPGLQSSMSPWGELPPEPVAPQVFNPNPYAAPTNFSPPTQPQAYRKFSDIPWYRRSDYNSWLLVSHLLTCGCCAPLILITCVSLITGDIYYNKRDANGKFKTWSFGNKVVAVLLLIYSVGVFVVAVLNRSITNAQ